MTERNDLENMLLNLCLSNKKAFASIIRSSLVDTKILTNDEGNQVIADFLNNNIDKISTLNLIYIVQQLIKENISPFAGYRIENFFTREEIFLTIQTVKERKETVLPLIFENVIKLSDKNEYLVVLTAQEIRKIQQSGIIKVIEGMQRESETTVFGHEIVSHVKFNPQASREIFNCLIADNYYSTTLRWHLVEDDSDFAEYNYNNLKKRLEIIDGLIAEIDGQHRSTAIQMALTKNPHLNKLLPIIITIGDKKMAQNIINQDEKRQPVNTEQLIVYENNPSTEILQEVKKRLKDTSWKFFITDKQYIDRNGFISESVFVELLNSLSMFQEINKNEQRKWVISFSIVFKDLERVFEKNNKKFVTDNTFSFKKHTKEPSIYRWGYGTIVFITYVIILSFIRDINIDDYIAIMDREDLGAISFFITSIKPNVTKQRLKETRFRITIQSTLETINKSFRKYGINYVSKYFEISKTITVDKIKKEKNAFKQID